MSNIINYFNYECNSMKQCSAMWVFMITLQLVAGLVALAVIFNIILFLVTCRWNRKDSKVDDSSTESVTPSPAPTSAGKFVKIYILSIE